MTDPAETSPEPRAPQTYPHSTAQTLSELDEVRHQLNEIEESSLRLLQKERKLCQKERRLVERALRMSGAFVSLTASKGIKAQLGTALSTEDANRAIYRCANGESIRQIAQDTNIPYTILADWLEKHMTDDEWTHKVNIARRTTSLLAPEIDDHERRKKGGRPISSICESGVMTML